VRTPFRRLLLIAALGACADEAPPEPDILELAAKNPWVTQVQAPDGTYRTPRYGDPELERAESALRDIPRPWTVSRMLRRYRDAKSVERKVLLLGVLAASRDPRAAVVLGETLHDEELDLRVAATVGIVDYFFDDRFGGANLESMMTAADEWWQSNEARLRAEAQRLARRWPE
jgi:hypothetical protein